MKSTEIVTLVLGGLLTPAMLFAQPAPAVAPPAAPAADPASAPTAVDPSAPPAEPLPPEPVPLAPVAPAEPPARSIEAAPVEAAPVEAEEAPKPPDRLSVGKEAGFFQPGALLQFWTTYSHQEEQKDKFAFRLRRAELKAKGDIVPKRVSYQLMLDAAKFPKFTTVDVTDEATGATIPVTQPDGSDQGVLQDFFITFISDYADVSLGQFKTPLGLEALQSSSKLLFPERADAVRLYGDKRDLGIRVDKKLGEMFYYQLGLFNGSGLNAPEVDNDKNGALRLEFYPIKGVTVGAVGFATIGARETRTQDRVEVDLRYEGNNLIAQGEYVRGWDGDGPEGDPTVSGHGTYVAAGYTILDVLQPVARFGFVDADLHEDATNDMRTKYEVGANYFIQGHEARVGLAAAFTDHEDPDVPLLSEVTFAAQVAF